MSIFSIDIGSLNQANVATGADNAAQINDYSISQASDLENNCNEFEEGTNNVFCSMQTVDNEIEGDVDQSNEALGSAGALISQNNQIDGDDALGIPGISQFEVADNTCGQTGSGDNLAVCDMFSSSNLVDSISQSNFVSNADDGTVISQDNGAVISQAIDLENDCDENTISGTHDNNANCSLSPDGNLDNFLGPLSQDNQVEAFDNSISNQGNNVAVSQDLLADNDCNGTGGNVVQCTNDGFTNFDVIDDFNFIDSIDQFNSATLSGDVSSDQINDLAIAQSGALVNTCDETGGGVNQVACENVGDINFVGPVFQSNTVDAPNSDTATQSNGAQMTQNLQAINDCDEEGTGFNFAECSNDFSVNVIESITQTNDATVGGDTAQSNFVGVVQDMQLENVCDETGVGDNVCNM